MRPHRIVLIAVLLAAACQGAADSATTTLPSVTTAGQEVFVEATGFLFRPETVSVPLGTTVLFVNRDNIDHTVTSGTPEAATDIFDLELPELGATAELVLESPGTFEYFCSVHNHMRGTIEVTEP